MARERDGKQTFGRGRRVGQPSTLADLGGRVKRLAADPRFQALGHRDARILFVALVQFGDGLGRWYAKHETVASAAGVSVSAAQRAARGFTDPRLAELVDPPRPLVTVEPWLRPLGAAGGPQGSNTYTLDPTLATSTSLGTSDHPYPRGRSDDPPRLFTSDER